MNWKDRWAQSSHFALLAVLVDHKRDKRCRCNRRWFMNDFRTSIPFFLTDYCLLSPVSFLFALRSLLLLHSAIRIPQSTMWRSCIQNPKCEDHVSWIVMQSLHERPPLYSCIPHLGWFHKKLKEGSVICFVWKYFLSPPATVHHMIPGIGIFYS